MLAVPPPPSPNDGGEPHERRGSNQAVAGQLVPEREHARMPHKFSEWPHDPRPACLRFRYAHVEAERPEELRASLRLR
jgi:hypothetical protein